MRYATPEEAQQWEAIIPNANDVVSPKVLEPADVLTAYRDGITIIVRNTADLSPRLLGEITRLNDQETAKHPEQLNRFDPEAVMEGGGIIAFATSANRLIAAVRGIRRTENDQQTMHVEALVSDGSVRGIATPLVLSLFLGEAWTSGLMRDGEAIARVLHCGTVNLGSSKTLARLGFHAAEVFTHRLTWRNAQKACYGDQAEPDSRLTYLRLKARAKVIWSAVPQILEGWDISVRALDAG